MEELISNYLFQYKKCPLPSIGSLELADGNVISLPGQNKMLPPLPQITLSEKELSPADFIRYIANQQNISKELAFDKLQQYCAGLHKMDVLDKSVLPAAGKFYVNTEGKLVFRQEDIPEEFLPVVLTERVVHPDVVHSMRVGDKETNSVVMTEYFSEVAKGARSWWWIAAIVLALLGGAALYYYFTGANPSSSFGNGQKIEIPDGTNTYYLQVN